MILIHRSIAALILAAAAASIATDASAQIKPMSSGHLSHNAPQMRRHGSGFHRPNLPHSHRYRLHHHHHAEPLLPEHDR